MAKQSLYLFLLCAIGFSSADNNMGASYDTIVVGLGAAGVTAAATLAGGGRRVLGVEAQGRIGGRVHTVPFGDGLVELGAEWIHGEHPSRVYDAAIKNNITLLPQDMISSTYRSDGSLVDQDLMSDLMTYCFEVIEDPPKVNDSLGSVITKKLMEYIKEKRPALLADTDFITEFLEFINLLVNNYEASNDWTDVSAQTKYEELEGHQHMSWHRHGYKTFFDLLLNQYNNGTGLPNLEMKLNTEVSQIAYHQDPTRPVTVTCKDGTTYTADNVIVTVSLGVLKERHTSLFSPPLPKDKVTAIDKLSIGIIDKIVLSFPKKWWPSNIAAFGFIWNGIDKAKVGQEDYWITRVYGATVPMGSTNTLTLWTNGDIAKMVEGLPDDVVKTKAVELLRRFMGVNTTVPEPTAILRSNWYSNPHTRGSYTFDNLNFTSHPTARSDLARPLTDEAGTPRVLFAGEATDPLHFSTVHGATDTGYREAIRLLPDSKI